MESNVMVGLCIKNVSFFPKVMCHIVHHNEQNKTSKNLHEYKAEIKLTEDYQHMESMLEYVNIHRANSLTHTFPPHPGQ